MLMKIQDVSIRFGGVVALGGVSFEVHEGEILGIIGPNGAGKTTLFNVINGVYHPDHGNIYLRDKDITRLKSYEIIKRGIARTFQVAQPFPDLTVLENVATA